MDNKKTALFGAVIAVAAGLFGANAAQINNSQTVLTNSLAEGSPIYGHVILVAKDPSGHVYAYRQSDNMIVNQGINCIGVALFRTVQTGTSTADANACGNGSAGSIGTAYNIVSGFRWIQIGTSSVAIDATQHGLQSTITAATTGLISKSIAPTITPVGTLTTGSASGIGPVVVISITNMGVTYTGSATSVKEAGLFDGSATTANLFSRVTFGPVGMSLGDTLSVTWSITLAHS